MDPQKYLQYHESITLTSISWRATSHLRHHHWVLDMFGGDRNFTLTFYYPPEVRTGEYICGWEYSCCNLILPSGQDMKTIACYLHKHEHNYSWVVKIRKTLEAVLGPQYFSWP